MDIVNREEVDNTNYSPLQYQCKLGKNQLIFEALIDTCACGGNYIDQNVAQRLLQRQDNNVVMKKGAEPLGLEGFNGKAGPTVTHYIEVEMTVGRHWEQNCRFEVTDLGKPKVMIGKNWLKEHGCVIDMANQELWFYGGHCSHEGAPKKISEPDQSRIIQLALPQPGEANPQSQRTRPTSSNKNLNRRVQKKLPKGMGVKDLQPGEKERIDKSTTSKHSSVRCTTPQYLEYEEGEEPEELKYYLQRRD